MCTRVRTRATPKRTPNREHNNLVTVARVVREVLRSLESRPQNTFARTCRVHNAGIRILSEPHQHRLELIDKEVLAVHRCRSPSPPELDEHGAGAARSEMTMDRSSYRAVPGGWMANRRGGSPK